MSMQAIGYPRVHNLHYFQSANFANVGAAIEHDDAIRVMKRLINTSGDIWSDNFSSLSAEARCVSNLDSTGTGAEYLIIRVHAWGWRGGCIVHRRISEGLAQKFSFVPPPFAQESNQF